MPTLVKAAESRPTSAVASEADLEWVWRGPAAQIDKMLVFLAGIADRFNV